MPWRMCSVFILAAGAVCAAGGGKTPAAGKPATSTVQPTPGTGPTSLTIVESKVVDQLVVLERQGKYGEILKITLRTDLKHRTYAFRRAVLLVQSEARRRTKSFGEAEKSLRKLLKFAQDLPEYNRSDAVEPLLLPVHIFKHVKRGYYQSPRRLDSVTMRRFREKTIADDGTWEAAKRDFATYMLEELDKLLVKLDRQSTPQSLKRRMDEMLQTTDSVRWHFRAMANKKTVVIISSAIKRYNKIMDPPCKEFTGKATKLRKKKLWPRGRIITPRQKEAVAKKIWSSVRSLYVINYLWGQTLTRYARKHGLLKQTKGGLRNLASRQDKLRRSWRWMSSWT